MEREAKRILALGKTIILKVIFSIFWMLYFHAKLRESHLQFGLYFPFCSPGKDN